MKLIDYRVDGAVALITLDRPAQANAQTPTLLTELDAAFDRACGDDGVRAIILAANGRHFSAGHDLSPEAGPEYDSFDLFSDVPQNGLHKLYLWESKYYFGLCRKWRDLPKPTIAAVQGACIAAGLMLAWSCDLIIAADNARFSDPVARMGMGGVEYHGHTWELGARKAKELLFMASAIDANEAHRLGMVNRVVPLSELGEVAMEMARRIAEMPPHAILMAKQAVNQTLDAMGQGVALQSAFALHSMGHLNAWAATGRPALVDLAELKGKAGAPPQKG